MHPIGKSICLSGILVVWVLALSAQSKQKLWTTTTEASINLSGERRIIPNRYTAVRFDTSGLKLRLNAAPHEQVSTPETSTVQLNIPWPDGGSKAFSIVRYDMMEFDLAERYPEILTGYGVSLEKDGYVLRFDWTREGFHGMITGPEQSVYIDPYCQGNVQDYLVYYKKDFIPPFSGFPCTQQEEDSEELDFSGETPIKSGDCIFRSYRLAVAATAQYSQYHGAANPSDAALVLSAITTVINRVNQVFERDLTIRLLLVANTDEVFFYYTGSQPYLNSPEPLELTNNQNTLDAFIGSANYDIGHVFGTGSGGLATASTVCKSSKARGATGLANPIGDPFNIDFVAHELGHQFGASHTQNNDCNRNLPTAMEVGSGSTIMGYAGVCSPNVQDHSDDYFHGVSLAQIGAYITLGLGNVCDTPIPMDHSATSVQGGLDHYIPAGTPFVLEATVSDTISNDLFISWEQWDNAAGVVMPPAPDNQVGPLFRSFPPSIARSRYFPQLSDLVTNNSPEWEVIPNETRNLNFQVTARNLLGAQGCTDEDQVLLKVEKDFGPFLVSHPNTAVTWTEGDIVEVNWEVADTDMPPVNCSYVDIRLSYDGGYTYPKLLAGQAPNTGSAMVQLPVGVSDQCRIMVRAADNVFLDISDEDFSIEASSEADFTLEPQAVSRAACPFEMAIYPIRIGQLAGFEQAVNLSVIGVPAGVSPHFSANPVNPNNSSSLSLSNLSGLPPGSYSFTLRASSNGSTKELTLYLQVMAAPETISLDVPANLQIDLPLQPMIRWVADPVATNYRLEMASNPDFMDLLLAATTINNNYIPPFELPSGTNIYWRVRARSNCVGSWSEVRRFRTIPCASYYSNTSYPMPNGLVEITSPIQISESGTLEDLSVINLKGIHEWIEDLTFSLIAPDMTEITLINQICGAEDNYHLNLDDEAALSNFSCPPIDNQFYQPQTPLSNLDGKAIGGTWTLKVRDNFSLSAPGELQSWGLQVCASAFSGVALPVELLSFSAKADEDRILLHWSTGSEQNNQGFEIQRRSSEEPSFKVIGWMAGQGNTDQLTNYQFIDQQVVAGIKYYYRLYQIDYDDNGTFSPLRSASLWKDQSIPVRVFPNPVNDQLYIESWASLTENVQLVLIDAQGRTVYREQLEGERASIDMSGFAAGVYCLHVFTRFDNWAVMVVR